MQICTIWDDGLVSDLPLIRWLERRQLQATFALSPGRYTTIRRLNDARGPYGELVVLSELDHYGSQHICAHGWSHRDLRTLTDAELHCELMEFRDALSEWFFRPVETLVYPYGRTDTRVIQQASQYYRAARSLAPQSKAITVRPWQNLHDIWPTAHWAVPDLVGWLLREQCERAILWGHTYEFAQRSNGDEDARTLYRLLQDAGAEFVSLERILDVEPDPDRALRV